MVHDRLASIIILAFCAFFYYQTFGISNKNLTGLEATFFPRILLGSIAVLAVLLLIRSFLIKKSAAIEDEDKKESQEKMGAWWKVPLIFALFALYILVIDILGFTVSSSLFMAIVYLIAIPVPVKKNMKRHALSIAFLIAVSIALTFVFEQFLQVYLPEGLFF